MYYNIIVERNAKIEGTLKEEGYEKSKKKFGKIV
jgi:hypothetical protein